MPAILHATLALAFTGCGAFFLDAPAQGSIHASATLQVEAAVHAPGRVAIVEQAPGQGFVVENASAPFIALDGNATASAGVVVGTSGGGLIEAGGGNDDGACPGGRCSTAIETGGRACTGGGCSGVGVEGAARGVDVHAGAATGGACTGGGCSGVAVEGAARGVDVHAGAAVDGERDACTSGGCAGVVVERSTSGGGGARPEGPCAGGRCPMPGARTGGAGASGGITIEARAEVPRQGVWSVDGRPTALSAIVGPGVQVDGVRVHLDELRALAEQTLPPAPSAQLPTDGAIEAWAELEHETLPRSGGETHVVVRVRGREGLEVPRGRVRVHLVVDRSSSMQRSWARVLAAARLLIERLRPEDELHIVAYGTRATEAWPLGRVGDGRAAIAALDDISVGGGTNIEAGLELAYGAAARASGDARSLVLLLSDGVPNHGAFEPAELGRLAAQARLRGCTTSVIGLGSEFDARLLRAIARQGRGGYHVSARIEALAPGLVAELEGHARVAATGVSVRVTLPSDVELVSLAEGSAERIAGGVALTVPHLALGEERRIVLRVRVPAGRRAREVASVALAYRSAVAGPVQAARSLDVSFGARAVVRAEGPAGAGVMGASLAVALDSAGQAILVGDAPTATRALEEHAAWMEGRVEHRRSATVRTRVRVVRRLARAVGELLPRSSHSQRRQVALAFGGLAERLQR